jgi:hypothetical protein
MLPTVKRECIEAFVSEMVTKDKEPVKWLLGEVLDISDDDMDLFEYMAQTAKGLAEGVDVDKKTQRGIELKIMYLAMTVLSLIDRSYDIAEMQED